MCSFAPPQPLKLAMPAKLPLIWSLAMQDDLFEALCATLDQLSAGFVACHADGHILHANHAAREMMEEGWPIQYQNGYVRAADRRRSDFLLECMQQAAETAAIRGPGAICVHVSLATMQSDGGAAIATVKPLVVRKPVNG